ncbi:helix-turn-helix domain-containing protein [Paenarthrobacter nitroguajacolicus]|uniref:helix-turn-helix domain-containing protein n=1 Tax=Paenarthrobacter nitroguajacolicus TaxID=211146 RepID=UPI000B898502|nr:helix-turn-helix transcriptional regulator [Paenarthrobacter nitroguajacolicus]
MGQLASRLWASSVSARVGKNIQKARKEASMSAQDLSNGCEEAGYLIPRSTIANIESGRKETVSLQELTVIAYVLGVPPLMLIFYPYDAAEVVQAVPGRDQLAVDAAENFAFSRHGESPLGELGEKVMMLRGMEESAINMLSLSEGVRSGRSGLPGQLAGLDDESRAEVAQQTADAWDKSAETLARKAAARRAELIKDRVDLWEVPEELRAIFAKVQADGDD